MRILSYRSNLLQNTALSIKSSFADVRCDTVRNIHNKTVGNKSERHDESVQSDPDMVFLSFEDQFGLIVDHQ